MENINKYTIEVDCKKYDFYEYITGELQCPCIPIPRFDDPSEYEYWFKCLRREICKIIYLGDMKMILNPYDCSWSVWGKKIPDGDGGVYAII